MKTENYIILKQYVNYNLTDEIKFNESINNQVDLMEVYEILSGFSEEIINGLRPLNDKFNREQNFINNSMFVFTESFIISIDNLLEQNISSSLRDFLNLTKSVIYILKNNFLK